MIIAIGLCTHQLHAQTDVTRTIWTITQTFAVENPCTEEIVDLTVIMTIESHTVTNKNGTRMYTKQKHVWDGIGRTSGLRYHGIYSGSGHRHDLNNGGSTVHSKSNIVLVSKGSSANWHLKYITHETVNANGAPTASVDINNSICK
ncbi:MAG: hypothetical protein CL946_07955 [Ectothiorhodospiraceae bacterium]|nr:hypothetical protein [Ectothiorhodospiraceae bacterium]